MEYLTQIPNEGWLPEMDEAIFWLWPRRTYLPTYTYNRLIFDLEREKSNHLLTVVPLLRVTEIFYMQTNLQHLKSFTALLCSRHPELHTSLQIILIQKPLAYRGCICGLGRMSWGNILRFWEREKQYNSAFCRRQEAWSVCSQDVVAMKITYWTDGKRAEAFVNLAYLSFDSIFPRFSKNILDIVT